MKRFLPFLLLAAPLMAQDQTLEPTGTVAETNTDCDATAAWTRTSDNSDATFCDGGDGAASDAESYDLDLSFATPSSNPSTATDAQEFQCRVQRSNTGNTDPTFTMDYECSGVSKVVGATKTVTSTSVVEFTQLFTYTTDANCDAAGANLELGVKVTRSGGSPTTRRSVDSVDCDWDVTHVAAGGARRVIVIGN